MFGLFCRERLKIDSSRAKDNPAEQLYCGHQHGDDWDHLRMVEEVPVGISLSEYVSVDANAVTTGVLDCGDILRVLGEVEEIPAEGSGEDVEDIEAHVPPRIKQ
ncbi:hypothetical protein HPB48_009256 [Haemaphysalis longicornis]|uniref:Uncharacterized protein n=1 Tax=Haemaphysalis longicornis TaxID=44386 RepID=A0A9J6GH75_HAELO|nr:hypothetical protein HPB48_009256 [Haemaphysalis longicornis]